ncbi:hypothetical protein [Asticcacaulis sp. W401b]|uniref:hypothetical protein n=1 Tax=Asticcacaulis sp. W401b TaxID=3388666 RepID=UPI003970B692
MMQPASNECFDSVPVGGAREEELEHDRIVEQLLTSMTAATAQLNFLKKQTCGQELL